MADRTETQRRRGNGSVGRTADLGVTLAAKPVQDIEAPSPAQSGAIAALTQRLNRLTQELSESRQRGEQLKAAFERHGRRLQQLIGERDRLTSLLAARDLELRQLNRELGALTERATPAKRRSHALLLAAAGRLFERIQQPRKSFRNTRPAALQPQKAASEPNGTRLVPWLKEGDPREVVAVALFGLSDAEIEGVLEAVERGSAKQDLIPLLLTDSDTFELFRGRRVLFEFLPARSDQERLAPELDWRLYTLRRLALIRRKWQPVRVVAFGRRATEVVQLWRDSPFEERPLPTPLDARSGPELAWSPARPSVMAPR